MAMKEVGEEKRKCSMAKTIGEKADKCLPFPEAKEIVRSWGLGSRRQFHKYIKEKRPEGIPFSPEAT
jgi:hypothetical protein